MSNQNGYPVSVKFDFEEHNDLTLGGIFHLKQISEYEDGEWYTIPVERRDVFLSPIEDGTNSHPERPEHYICNSDT